MSAGGGSASGGEREFMVPGLDIAVKQFSHLLAENTILV
jgi:hypothetical protein